MTHVISQSWTEEDIARLRSLSEAGATIVRAAAALNRKTASVRKFAKLHNLPLLGVRQTRAAIRKVDIAQSTR